MPANRVPLSRRIRSVIAGSASMLIAALEAAAQQDSVVPRKHVDAARADGQ